MAKKKNIRPSPFSKKKKHNILHFFLLKKYLQMTQESKIANYLLFFLLLISCVYTEYLPESYLLATVDGEP